MISANLYEQVRESLFTRITGGEFKAGDKLPTEDELCKEYGVSRITVRRAIAELTAQMLVSPKRGVGTVVMDRGVDKRVFRLNGLFGVGATFKPKMIMRAAESATAEVAKALRLTQGAPVLHMRFTSHRQNKPFTLTDAYEAGTEIKEGKGWTTKMVASPTSRRVQRAEQELVAVISDALCEKYLGYRAGQPMMEARRIIYATDGLPIRYSISRYHPDRYRFLVDLLPTKGSAIFETTPG